jgi:glycerol kinase
MPVAAIDQGTSSTRVLVVAQDGAPKILRSIRHRQIHPQSGWVEHDPLELLGNVQSCIEAAGSVEAIGIANQGESCLAWDALTGEPLSPVIVWQDNRTNQILEQMRRDGLEPLALERAGLPLHSYFSASKLTWILRTIPAAAEARRRGRLRLGTTDSFFLDRLTGVFATDITTASRTSLMNMATDQWDGELCRVFDVPMESLPEIRSTADSFGHVDGTPIVVSIADQQSALYGHGGRCAGDAKITFGSGAFMLALTSNEIVRTECGLLPTVAWRLDGITTYALDGGVFHAGTAIEWAHQLGLFADFSELAWFESEAAISRSLVFVPALSGLACPHWDSTAAGLWIGMSANTSRADLCQSILEGVALRTAEVISAMNARVALKNPIAVDGGLARSRYFAQFLADASGWSIATKAFDELTAFGCAALTARGIGHSLEPLEEGQQIYHPREVKGQIWRERFDEAVNRARQWR